MKYRDHRGSLSDSMETEREVNSVDEIKKHLNKLYNQFGKEIEEVKFEHVGFDDRIGWDTYYVTKRLKGEKEFTVAGMSDGLINKKMKKNKALSLAILASTIFILGAYYMGNHVLGTFNSPTAEQVAGFLTGVFLWVILGAIGLGVYELYRAIDEYL